MNGKLKTTYVDADGNIKQFDNVVASIGKKDGIDELISESAELQDVDAKTKLFTNYLNSIDRNKGFDDTGVYTTTGGYALGANSSEAWYNEAFDGMCVIVVSSAIEIGFKSTNGNEDDLNAVSRTAAIDTKLQPARNSQSDLFKDYVISYFRTSDTTNKPSGGCDYLFPESGSNQIVSPHFNNEDKNNKGYIGSYAIPSTAGEGSSLNESEIMEVKLDLASLYRSKDFLIPNASVMDLY
jgi:hypothetical protein